MALSDFLEIDFKLDTSGVNTTYLDSAGRLKVVDTGRANNNVKRLGIEATGFEAGAEAAWNTVREAIYMDIEGSLGIVVGRLPDLDGNDDHTFVISRQGNKFKVTINWRLKGGGISGGPPEDSTGQ